ncbi:antibiotic biosynthesis monooxygenase [Enterococcus sp. BWB1-3]|uniref:antibiotic biosynthesis monooxygenase family protein n=1 Tax=unclassified Enterococcus TaxID=2608891 RepID=UPI001921E706|nr:MULTISPECIES: antibiotic biosynthesis monooxygenase family protein [unclassified Enterococcus]MBL1229011.1 antibiotic biosynthesis monooxygenase [Enterococcus sp. BWB1-3]MCB5952280.1 antibiotic biosynthesis monooxygenase [Enterococcus sp. BWT-B8]MCB5955491.1 antibiotic biosynthesis monooxygenase [Enterococcus sp. CWB-B31]
MFVQSVTFVVKKEGKEHFENKTKKDVVSMLGRDTCLSSECWFAETKDTCEFVLVSKWKDKKAFQAWLKRPEHLQQHREAHKNKDSRPNIVVEKIKKGYTILE